MEKKYILFDLDGTIVDSGEGIKNSIKYSLKKFGIEEKGDEVLNNFIGPPLADSYMKYFNLNEQEADKIVQIYREYYKDDGVYENKLYDGIVDVISELKLRGNNIFLATSKPLIFAKKVLEQHKLTSYFDFVAGATLDNKISEKKDVIKYIIDSNTLKASNAYMIGDTKFDIYGGKFFNFKTIGVTYGYGSYEELKEYKADFIVDSPKEILEILEE
ncbi:HAD hydrolase-like protein [Peptostreptococcaceae bacterium OttesenSCG-928-C18]|nr:HAD hydrolase-like protein [Peptostreptococcaceae bacterium OttesenSCG-928-C18]